MSKKAKKTKFYSFFLPSPDYDDLNRWMCEQPATINQTVIAALEHYRKAQQQAQTTLSSITVEVTDEKAK